MMEYKTEAGRRKAEAQMRRSGWLYFRLPSSAFLLCCALTSLATNVSAFKNLPYDPVRDFAPITLCFTTPLYLVVHPSLPVRTVKQLIALAKAQPGKLTFASGGHASTNHLA